MLDDITPIILTFNEESNIERTLSALKWAQRVLVIDSGSTDATKHLCSQFSNTQLIVHPFENAAEQCNFALQQNIETEWVLSLDADYVLSTELTQELSRLVPDKAVRGYEIAFKYLVDGTPLRGSLYPPRTCLYRHRFAKYIQDGHTQRVSVEGQQGALKGTIHHDDRKPYSRWLSSQKRYAKLEAEKIQAQPFAQLKTVDKFRRLGLGPLLIVPYTLFLKRLFLDGKPGWKYTLQRFTAEKEIWKALFLNAYEKQSSGAERESNP